MICVLFFEKIAPNNDNFMYYLIWLKVYIFLVFLHPYIMDFWNILQQFKKCKNLTNSALGGVRDLNRVDHVVPATHVCIRVEADMKCCLVILAVSFIHCCLQEQKRS